MTRFAVNTDLLIKTRNEKGYSIEELARLTKLTPKYIEELESRTKKSSYPTLSRIAAVLEIPTHLLIRG